jgi:GNAT superfamily N-acetyltransferase
MDSSLSGARKIRSVLSADLAEFQRLLGHLDTSDCVARFRQRLKPAARAAYAVEALANNQITLGCFAGSALCGVGELCHIAGTPRDTVELAVMVDRAWRRRGIATALVARLLEAAFDLQVARIVISGRADDPSIKRLAVRFGGSVSYIGFDFVSVIAISPNPMHQFSLRHAAPASRDAVPPASARPASDCR